MLVVIPGPSKSSFVPFKMSLYAPQDDRQTERYIIDRSVYAFPTPPNTPPKYTPTPPPPQSQPIAHTYIIQHLPPPEPKPWYTYPSAVIIIIAAFCTIIFTVVRIEPLILSSADAVGNIGRVFGSAAHVTNAFGNSIHQTTRFGAEIAGAVGDIWCSVVGGSGCPAPEPDSYEYAPGSLPEAGALAGNALIEGTRVVGALEQFGLLKTNVTATCE